MNYLSKILKVILLAFSSYMGYTYPIVTIIVITYLCVVYLLGKVANANN